MTTNQRGAGRGAGAGRSNFVYQPRSQDSATQRRERYQSGNRDSFVVPNVELWKPKDGDNWIRILPPTWDNADHYALELFVHYEVGPDNGTYLCPNKMRGEPCGLCDEYHAAKSAKEEDYARALEVSMRLAAWIVDREEEKKGVQLWLYSMAQDREIMQQAYDRRTGETIMIDHPNDGYDIEFTRRGKGLQTKYSGFKLSRQPSDVAASHLQFVQETPLPTILKYYDSEYIMNVFAGAGAAPTAQEEQRRPDRAQDRQQQPERQQQPDRAAPQRQQVQTRAATGTQQSGGAQQRTATQGQAAGGSANNARRARLQQQKPQEEKQLPDFYKMSINELLDWGEARNLIPPEDVADDEIAKWLEQKVLDDDIPF